MSGIADAKIGAVLRAEDYQRAKVFYSEVLGLEVDDGPRQQGTGVVKSSSGSSFMIYERPGMPAPQNTTLGFSVTDFDAALEDLRGRGVEFEDYDIPEIGLKTVDGVATYEDGSKVAWFTDTEGNILTISTM